MIATNKELQRFWLREQENLVIMLQERQELIRDINLLRKQVMILDQKNLTIGDDIDDLRKQDERMDRSIKYLLSKLETQQDMLNKKRISSDEMSKENVYMEGDYMAKLRDSEMETLKLQTLLTDMEEEKIQLSKELIERNREALAWQTKIQMVSEARSDMSKESSGESEVAMMKREIHRMTVG